MNQKLRIETDGPGDAYLLSISNFEASVSSYLVGAPSTTVGPVTDSNTGTESMKTGRPPSHVSFQCCNRLCKNRLYPILMKRNERDCKQRNKTGKES